MRHRSVRAHTMQAKGKIKIGSILAMYPRMIRRQRLLGIMDRGERLDYAWMQRQLIDFVRRISDLRDASRRLELFEGPLGHENVWIEIHRLLTELHEQIADDAGYEIVSPVMQRLGHAISTLEHLTETDVSENGPAVLH